MRIPRRRRGRLPFVLADPPPGFSVAGAERFTTEPDPTLGQLWATWSADPSTATWVAIAAWPSDQPFSTIGTSRVWLSTGVGIVTHAADGTVTLDGNRDGFHVSIQAGGLDTPALAAIMDSLVFDRGQLAGSQRAG